MHNVCTMLCTIQCTVKSAVARSAGERSRCCQILLTPVSSGYVDENRRRPVRRAREGAPAACGGDRRGPRRAGGGDAARRQGLPGDGDRPARHAGRPGERHQRQRPSLRPRADDRHRAAGVPRAVGGLRAGLRRGRRPAVARPVLRDPLPRRLDLHRPAGRRGDAGGGGAAVAGRPRRLRPVPRGQRAALPGAATRTSAGGRWTG